MKKIRAYWFSQDGMFLEGVVMADDMRWLRYVGAKAARTRKRLATEACWRAQWEQEARAQHDEAEEAKAEAIRQWPV